MADFIWLLFLDSSDLDHFFLGSDIPFDCEFLVAQQLDSQSQVVQLTEVYRVSPTMALQQSFFGNWTPIDGLWTTSLSFYERRNNLQGLTLKTAYYHVCLTDYQACYDQSFGIKEANGSWTGLIGMLQRREVDVVNADVTMTSERLDVVDFMTPLVSTRFHLAIKQTNTFDLKIGTFLMPFSPCLWTTVLVVLILLVVCITGTYRLLRRYGKCDVNDCSFLSSTLLTIGVFCQQGIGSPSKTSPLRIVFLTAHLTALVLVAIYSASFTSYLTLRNPTLPFTDFQGFYDDGTYKLSVVKNTVELHYFKNSSIKTLRQIYAKFLAPQHNSQPLSDMEGMQRLCEDEKMAHLSSSQPLISTLGAINCSIALIPNAFIPAFVGFATTKGSPYRGLFNH
ncbi:hypothetical protein ANN_24328, partial [Periplaneta americana]